jgi:hypothetical protein
MDRLLSLLLLSFENVFRPILANQSAKRFSTGPEPSEALSAVNETQSLTACRSELLGCSHVYSRRRQFRELCIRLSLFFKSCLKKFFTLLIL